MRSNLPGIARSRSHHVVEVGFFRRPSQCLYQSFWSFHVNRHLNLLAIALGVSIPLFASAQSSSTQGLTRDQVRQELAQYQAAGFNPARHNPRTWVDDAQLASAKVMTARAAETSPQLAAGKTDEARRRD